ncbi:MAG: V-type ATPase subunit [Ruminococcus sp.]|nr:V-type ATPase subunit [Ruminococcus sp.]
MALSYEFSIGSVRARENYMLTSQDADRMISCKSEEELAAYLSDKGYGDGNTVDEVIASHESAVWEYLRSTAPDFELFSPFIIQNDIHNLKVVLKGTMADREYENLLIEPCTTGFSSLVEAVEKRRFTLLPEWLSKPADEAYEIIAHTGDARLCDAIIDRAAMERILKITEKSDSKFLSEYFKTTVFYNNIKIALRSSRTSAGKDYLVKALCEVEGFRTGAVINAALKGEDYLVGELEKYSEYDCNKAIAEYKKSPSGFERFVDNKLILAAKEICKRAGEGAEPIVGYFIGCMAEKKIIHIIASGIRTKTSAEQIRERLREIYG